MLPICGEIVTELHAITALTGAKAQLFAGGGVFGAEGAAWVGVSGNADQVYAAEDLISSVSHEPRWGEK